MVQRLHAKVVPKEIAILEAQVDAMVLVIVSNIAVALADTLVVAEVFRKAVAILNTKAL